MPDAGGNIKGIATTGKAGETIEKIFKRVPDDRGDGGPIVGFTSCWKTVEGQPGNCRKPIGHECDCAPF